LNFTC